MSGDILTDEMIAAIRRAVRDVAEGAGWGTVTIVVEKRRPTKLRREESMWLGRGEPPGRRVTARL